MNPFFFFLILLGAGAGGSGSKGETTETEEFISILPEEDDDAPTGGDDDAVEDPVEPPVAVEPPAPEDPPAEPPVAVEPPAPEDPPAEPPVSVDPPAPEEENPVPPIVVDDETPDAPEQPGDGGSGGEGVPTVISDGVTEVMAGRVTTLQTADDDVESVRIISGVENGNVTVNPDNSMALVMTLSDFTGSQSFTYEATHSDGSVTTHEVALDVIPGLQEAGWGTGAHHYMLGTDADGRVVVEHGDIHTKVYVTGSSSAISIEQIAAEQGVAVDDVDGRFIAEHGYGQTEETALDEIAAKKLWYELSPKTSYTSNWLLYERGYSYQEEVWIVSGGESELHPLYYGAWGEGEKPIIENGFPSTGANTDVSNILIQGLTIDGQGFLNARNVIMDDVEMTDQLNMQDSSGMTLRDSYVHHVSDPTVSWKQGAYFSDNEGVLVEGVIFDHNGWSDDGTDVSDKFSHNLYISRENTDVTLRDSISMRAAAWGAHVRSGGFIEDNAFIDNNAGIDWAGGDYFDEGPQGNYTLFADNLVTSAGYRTDGDGAFAKALSDAAYMTSLVDNIIAHLWDPNNPEEVAVRVESRGNLGTQYDNPYYNDTIIWNWPKYSHEWDDHFANTEGLDPDALNATTIQNYTADLLGQDIATIGDLADVLASQEYGLIPETVTADDIIRYFQDGFGLSVDDRINAETLRFIPNDLGDGVRWDNRLNWDTNDLPGSVPGDSVDLAGNHVIYGGTNEIRTLDFGDGGRLDLFHGKLTVADGMALNDDATLTIAEAGQFWTDGATGDGVLDIDVSGGRFVNYGKMDNADLTATGGQTVLATDNGEYDVAAGRTLAIFDAAAKVGFDDADGDMAILDLHEDSTLAYSAQSGDLGTIEEFRTGAMGDEPDVLSGVDLGSATLEIDLTGLSAEAGSVFTLIDSDELVGVLGDTLIGGLGGRDATIVVDYLNDRVTLELTSGSGKVNVASVGEQNYVDAGENALWDALTADQGLAEDAVLPPDEEELLDVA